MSMENILLDTTVTILDKDKQEKVGQIRYMIKGSEVEIFDTYLFPEYRRQKIMSSFVRQMIPGLKVFGVSKIKLRYLDEDAHIAWERMGFNHVDNGCNMELLI